MGLGLELAVSGRAPSPGRPSSRGAKAAAGSCRVSSPFSDVPTGIKAPLPLGPKERLRNESLRLSKVWLGSRACPWPNAYGKQVPDEVGGRLYFYSQLFILLTCPKIIRATRLAVPAVGAVYLPSPVTLSSAWCSLWSGACNLCHGQVEVLRALTLQVSTSPFLFPLCLWEGLSQTEAGSEHGEDTQSRAAANQNSVWNLCEN